jgi:predicted HTH transcriptional regulator
MTEDKLTNAAALLFGKRPKELFGDHFEIKCGKFPHDTEYDQVQTKRSLDKI